LEPLLEINQVGQENKAKSLKESCKRREERNNSALGDSSNNILIKNFNDETLLISQNKF
jgi:hypothetical protein